MKQPAHRERPATRLRAFGWWLALGLGLATVLPRAAAESAPSTTDIPYGSVWRISGPVTAEAPGQATPRPLREGDRVFVGERLRAAASGEAVIKTADAGLLALRPGAELVTEAFKADGGADDRWALRLLTGSVRLVTGWIARINRPGYRVTTATATIGVRGTDHEPYVLTAEAAGASAYREGTYDKVNRGATTLRAAGKDLDIEAGRVGFARAAGSGSTTRGLLTLLFPVLLDTVPGFYVPGQFEGEIESYSRNAEAASAQALAARQSPATVAAGDCAPRRIARDWVRRFDQAILRRDAGAIMALFAADATVKATVRNRDGSTTTVELNRQELADSTLASLADLQQYRQQRRSLEAWSTAGEAATCGRIGLRSAVSEQGRQRGKAYRFDSVEEFQLEFRDGQWLAVTAGTTQR